MKNFIKRVITFAVIGYAYQSAFSQATNGTVLNNNYNSTWYLGWSNNGVNPLLFKTNAINRSKFNGIVNYNISGYNGARNGYMLVGNDNNSISAGNPNIYTQKGAFSMLHLNGTGSQYQEFGYRPWMNAGVTFTGNRDLSYVGLRQVGTAEDFTEMTIMWSDNSGGGAGPDDMAFRFTGDGNGNTNISSNLQTNDDLDGLHIARFAPTGEFGLGNTFGINAPGTPANLYVRPASLGHYSLSDLRSVWQQFTNRDGTTGTGTGETANDGLRFGIIGNANTNINGTAALYNQENRALLFSTNANTNTINITGGATNERMRLMSVGTPTNLAGGGFGVFNPAGINTNFTRMAISHNPGNPITRPLSLLHLGYNTGAVAITPGTDGWRPWMDIGIFTTNGTDNVYLGLKDEGGPLGDRQDAVLSWGDNQVSGLPPGNGPDNFRMIFTSTTAPSGGGTPPATGVNGLEGMRMTPTTTAGVFTGIGGDPTANQYGPAGTSINPTATLEVNSWGVTTAPGGSSGLRFTNLNTTSPTTANPGTGVLSVNANGDVIYVPGGGSTFGNACGATPNPLTTDIEIPLNHHNLHFTGVGNSNTDIVAIGWNCGLNPLLNAYGKLDVVQLGTTSGIFTPTPYSIAGRFTSAPQTSPTIASIGIQAQALNSPNTNAGVYSIASGSGMANYGIFSTASGATSNYAGYFNGNVIRTGTDNFTSDSTLKQNIQPITDARGIIRQLLPKTYEFNHSVHPNMELPNGKQWGLLSQQVATILPELVTEITHPAQYDSLGNEEHASFTYKALNYQAFTSILIQAVKEQDTSIDSLKATNDSLVIVNNKQDSIINNLNDRLSRLENCLSGILPVLCQMSHNSIQQNTPEVQQAIRSQLSVYLSNREAIILDQNVPNPFAEQTTINFSIPETVQKAQIHFYDGTGKLLKVVDIRERGLGSITVFGSDLSAGTYMYTLVADGVNVATKKMVK
ncbi:MAG: tail fiber domain-containing protein [Flavobacteriia bacterium]|nr:tail fiber domain-containing protein [Flavobacteriia bacterium]OJX39346.1 MAG: hypothetical protein BGO87_05060 [Flavobacteriia bacterium 40-80]